MVLFVTAGKVFEAGGVLSDPVATVTVGMMGGLVPVSVAAVSRS